MYFRSLTGDGACRTNEVGLGQLATDLKSAATTPSLVYIVPSPCADGSEAPCKPHTTPGLAGANRFLKSVVPEIKHSPAYQDGGLIAITFDQAPQTGPDADSSACCGPSSYPNLRKLTTSPAVPPAAMGPDTTTTTATSSTTTAASTTTTAESTTTAPATTSTTSTTGSTTSTTSTTGSTPTTGSTSTTTPASTTPASSLGGGETTPTGGGGPRGGGGGGGWLVGCRLVGSGGAVAGGVGWCACLSLPCSVSSLLGALVLSCLAPAPFSLCCPAVSSLSALFPPARLFRVPFLFFPLLPTVGLLLISPYVKPNSTDVIDYFNHFSLLASIEKLFGLHTLGYAGATGLPVFGVGVFTNYSG